MDLLYIRARVHADLGDYYFKLKEFEKSLLNFRVWFAFFLFIALTTKKKNMRIFKQTRFDKEKFENAVENLRNAKKAVYLAKQRKIIAEKLKTLKPGNLLSLPFSFPHILNNWFLKETYKLVWNCWNSQQTMHSIFRRRKR